MTVQLSTPRWVVGRALSLYQTATFGGMAGGSWLWGVVAETHGAATWRLLVAAIACWPAGARAALVPLPPLATLNLDPLNRWTEPRCRSTSNRAAARSWSSSTIIIREEDISAFLDVMAERRRIRRRDGARQWTLMRDLENPEVWIETYHTPTWLEYVRHNQRDTRRRRHHRTPSRAAQRQPSRRACTA